MPEKNNDKPPSDKQPEPKPDPDPVKEAAKQEAVAHELRAQQILESGGRNVGPIMEQAAEAWKKAGDPAAAEVASKLAKQYIEKDAPPKKEKETT